MFYLEILLYIILSPATRFSFRLWTDVLFYACLRFGHIFIKLWRWSRKLGWTKHAVWKVKIQMSTNL